MRVRVRVRGNIKNTAVSIVSPGILLTTLAKTLYEFMSMHLAHFLSIRNNCVTSDIFIKKWDSFQRLLILFGPCK